MLDYVQAVCNQISKRYIKPPSWWAMPPHEEDTPKLRKPDVKCYEDKKTHKSRYCFRCKQSEENDRKRMLEQEEKKEEEQETMAMKKRRYKERMKKRARGNMNKKN